jgi:hypothetical protein
MDPNFAIAYQVLGQAHLARGMNREAVPVLEKYSTLTRSGADSLALLGYSTRTRGLCRDRVAVCWNLVILNGADGPSLVF